MEEDQSITWLRDYTQLEQEFIEKFQTFTGDTIYSMHIRKL